MPDDKTTNVVLGTGETKALTDAEIPYALQTGGHIEGAGEGYERAAQERQDAATKGWKGTAIAGGMGVARGVSFGVSDVIGAGMGLGPQMEAYRQAHPDAALGGEVVGALIDPAGIYGTLGRAGERFGARVIGEGIAGRVGGRIVGGALEGAGQGAGSYVSDVALGDRPLSADAFMGAMGKGALWGGVGAGALSIGSEGLASARRMFPAGEVTEAAVAKAEQEAAQEMGDHLKDSGDLQQAGEKQLETRRTQRAAADPEFAAKQNAIKLEYQKAVAEERLSTIRAAEEAKRAKITSKSGDDFLDNAMPKGARRRAFVSDETLDKIDAQGVAGSPAEQIANVFGTAKNSATDGFIDSMWDRVQNNRPIPRMGAVENELRDLQKAGKLVTRDDVEAIVNRASSSPASQLEQQLRATKNALDEGTPLGKLSGSTRGTVDDALNEHLASVDSSAKEILDSVNNLKASRSELGDWLDKYGQNNVAKFERSQAARDYAEGMRPKQAGYYTKVPAGEGNVMVPRGRYSQFRGTPAEQDAIDAEFYNGVLNSDRALANDRAGEFARIDEMLDGRSPIQASARDIIEAQPEPGEAPPIDEHVKQALRAKGEDFGGDLNKSAEAIGKYEQANADLAEKLGDAAPPSAKARGEGFREAQKTAADKTAQQAVNVARDMANAQAKGPAALVRQVTQSKPGQTLKHIAGGVDKALQGAELLRMLGVPIPDPRNIPVVGPLLSMYLKARVASKIMRRIGGGVERTAETVIASKAAVTRAEMYTAIDTMLAGASRKLDAAAPFAGAPTAALAHTLFDDRQPGERKPYTSKPKADDLPAMYLARTEELNKASQPGAVERAVKARIQTSDPEILQEIVASYQRKLDFYNSKWPRPNEPPGLLAPDNPYIPPRSELAKVGRYIEAGENPVGVFQAAAAGQFVPSEHIEAVAAIYPPLYADAQKRLVLKMSERKATVPYKQRQQMSRLFGVPLDSTANPDYGAFLQQGYKPTPPSPQPNQGVGGNVTLGTRVGTSFDSRGG